MSDASPAPAPVRPDRPAVVPWGFGLLIPYPFHLAVQVLTATVLIGLLGRDAVDSDALYWTFPPAVIGLIAYAALAGASLWVAGRRGDARLTLGLRRVPIGRTAWQVLVAFVAIVVLNAVLEPIFHGAERQGEQTGLDPSAFPGGGTAAAAGVLTVLLLCVAAPVAEEIFFRGLVHGALRRFGVPVATIGSAALFSSVHFVPAAIPVLFVVGAVLSLLYERTGSLIPGIAVHACINGLATGAALLSS